MDKKKKNSKQLCEMMEKTFKKRQQWVQQDEPPVQEILSIYPALKHSKVVCQSKLFLYINQLHCIMFSILYAAKTRVMFIVKT